MGQNPESQSGDRKDAGTTSGWLRKFMSKSLPTRCFCSYKTFNSEVDSFLMGWTGVCLFSEWFWGGRLGDCEERRVERGKLR